jgi:hypothetical protein
LATVAAGEFPECLAIDHLMAPICLREVPETHIARLNHAFAE